MKQKKVAIVVATCNDEKYLKECLMSLKKTNYDNYKVFFVDDTSRGIGPAIKKEFGVEVITTKGFSGQSRVWNLGIKKALEWDFDYVLLIDDDTEIVDKNWLKDLVKVGECDKDIGMLGCKLLYEDGSVQHIGGYMKGWQITIELDNEKKEVFEVDHVMGCFMLIKRKVIDKVGLIDEIFTPYLLEETSYCLTAKDQGFKIVSVPYVKVIHKKSKTIDTHSNAKKMFVRFKNDFIFSKRHLKGWNKLFRMFIFLPTIAILRKNADTDTLMVKNFKLRKEFPINLALLIGAFFYTIGKK